jgi:hypothetical protein
LLMLLFSGFASAQIKAESRTMVVNGRTGEVAIVNFDGRTYVDLENLARVANGSVGFRENQITLTVPPSTDSSEANLIDSEQAAEHGISPNFARAGIEAIAQMREWAGTMAYAIENGYAVTEKWAARFREQAAQSLAIATTAASTGPDREALQLLTNELDAVQQWSNNLLEAKKSMNTGKYATSPNALRDEPLSQKIMTCGRFVAGMLASGEFEDNPACH